MVSGCRLSVLSWNLEALPRASISDFLKAVSLQADWDILLLEECGTWGDGQSHYFNDHLFHISQAIPGQRCVGIVIHSRLAAYANNFYQRGRALSCILEHPDLKLKLGVAHLPQPNTRTIQDFHDAVEDIRHVFILSTCSWSS